MAYTRAKDRIQLSSGTILTLGEALDSGTLYLDETTNKGEDRYVARETDGDLFWPVGAMLFHTRRDKQRQILPADVRAFIADIAHNWDCDADAHRHGTTCRCCEAEKLLAIYERDQR